MTAEGRCPRIQAGAVPFEYPSVDHLGTQLQHVTTARVDFWMPDTEKELGLGRERKPGTSERVLLQLLSYPFVNCLPHLTAAIAFSFK